VAKQSRMPIPQAMETMLVDRARMGLEASIDITDDELVRMVVDENGFERIAVERIANEMVYRIRMLVATYPLQTITQERQVSWPNGWWQALRERVLPTKWLNKHPVARQCATLKCVLDLSSIYKQMEKAPKNEQSVVLCDTQFECPSQNSNWR